MQAVVHFLPINASNHKKMSFVINSARHRVVLGVESAAGKHGIEAFNSGSAVN